MNFELCGLKVIFENIAGFPVAKIEPENYYLLGMFLTVWNSFESVREDLIPYINDRLCHGLDVVVDDDGIAHLMSLEADAIAEAVIDRDKTKIISWDDSAVFCTLDSELFKQLVVLWLEFLESEKLK